MPKHSMGKALMTPQVDPQGIQLNGNPTGGGESHLYVKPNFNVLGQQFGQAAPPQESKEQRAAQLWGRQDLLPQSSSR